MDNYIPFSKPTIDDNDIKSVTNVLKSNWLTIGPKVKEFENKVKEYTGAKEVVAVDSCTSALTLSLQAIRLYYNEPNVTALVPALTFIATANAAFHAGYDVDFCDVNWDGNIDISKAKYNVYDMIIPVHFAGQMCNLEEIKKHSTFVIEDAAHAFGIYGLGTITNGACFSLYPTKNFTTIEGGLFLTEDTELANTVRSLSLHGLDSTHINRYERSSLARPTVNNYPGYKANMTDVEAALGISQLDKLKQFLIRREYIANYYFTSLNNKVRFLTSNNYERTWHMFVILVENRDWFVQEMKNKGIGVGVHYSPIIPFHLFYQGIGNYHKGDFPVAEYISEHCVSLPLFPSMTDEEIERVISSVKELV